MKTPSFDEEVAIHQVKWREKQKLDPTSGTQHGFTRPWILAKKAWENGLWPGIRSDLNHSLDSYLTENGILKHTGAHNLKSSWVLCANLYFPFQHDLPMMAAFLKDRVAGEIQSVEGIELEYEGEHPLDPQKLLGESKSGKRGTNQTSPDLAFIVNTSNGKGLVLTENKYVEHSFYSCSGRKSSAGNPDKTRCMNLPTLIDDLPMRCWQLGWKTDSRANRTYWNHLRLSDFGKETLNRCPAATAGYQLFRQQALAEGIAKSGKYDLVVTAVAYDKRNTTLIKCLRSTGLDTFADGWGKLFDGKARFATFTHQEWVSWVRDHDKSGRWKDWLGYVSNRYGYGQD